MRITLNLSTADGSRGRYTLAWAIPATVVGLVGLLGLGVSLAREIREYRAVQRQVAEVQQREDQLRGQEAAIRKDLENPEYGELLRQARFVNSLIDQKQLSVTELAAQFADLMPEDARLNGLSLAAKGEDLMVHFTIAAKSEEAIETFLGDLEDAPDFKDVTIINQGFQEAGAQPGQVSVACAARYLPGAR
jgi:heme exporter protein D